VTSRCKREGHALAPGGLSGRWRWSAFVRRWQRAGNETSRGGTMARRPSSYVPRTPSRRKPSARNLGSAGLMVLHEPRQSCVRRRKSQETHPVEDGQAGQYSQRQTGRVTLEVALSRRPRCPQLLVCRDNGTWYTAYLRPPRPDRVSDFPSFRTPSAAETRNIVGPHNLRAHPRKWSGRLSRCPDPSAFRRSDIDNRAESGAP
jgi:hypothetical protein